MSAKAGDAFPLRLVTLSSGVTHRGQRLHGRYFIACRLDSVTPSWKPGVRGTSGVVVGLNGDEPVTCRRCLRSGGAA